MADKSGREREAAVDAAVEDVVRELEPDGVTKAHWAWREGGVATMWLVTTTDAEKLRVVEDGRFALLARAALSAGGVPLGVANRAEVTVESLETLDRDYDGSWARRLR
ncbi:MAG: hypothetical protein ACTHOK_20565 [Nocardioidaceae bacterium]